MTSSLPDHTKGLLCASGTALCWGVLAILLKNALKFTDSETIVAFRMIFAFIFLSLYFLATNPKAFKLIIKPPPLLLIGSLGLAFNYLGFMKGVAYSGASNAQIMIQTGPILLMLTGFIIYKEGIKFLQMFFIGVAVLGFVLFFKDQAAFITEDSLWTANIWILSAAVTWVVYSVVIKKLSADGHSANELNLVVFLICSLLLSTNLSLEKISQFSTFEWLFLFILGLNTLVAYGLFGAALKWAPASQISIIISLNPVLTLSIIALGGAYFHFIPNEPTSILGYTGAALVVAGVIFSTLTAQKNTSRPKP